MPDAPKSILVTGSNQGLGFFVAQKLLAHSDHLIVYVAARTKEKAKEATEKLKGAQDTNPIHSIVPVVIDLTDDSTIDAAVSQIEALDILVNNAGLYVRGDYSSPQSTRESLVLNFDTNLFGTMALTLAILPKLKEAAQKRNKHGEALCQKPSLINVTSGLASLDNMTNPNSAQYASDEICYSSSKTALNAFSIWLSKRNPDIRVVAVAPGHSATSLNNFSASQSAETGAQFIVGAVMDTLGQSGTYLQKGVHHAW